MTITCEAISAGCLCQGHVDIWGGEDWFHDAQAVADTEAVTAATSQTIHHVAKFHRAAWAKQFIARISEPGWHATNIQYKAGGIVEFDVETSEGYGQSWADWALTVGAYSSPNQPGVLDGRRAIPCY